MNRFSIKHGLYIAGLVAAALVPAPRGASAGFRSYEEVWINSTYRYAFGNLGNTFNSSDFVQFIGCQVDNYSSGYTYAYCTATDINGVSAWCMTDDPDMIAVASSLTPDAMLSFDWDTGGECTRISIFHGSNTFPKRIP